MKSVVCAIALAWAATFAHAAGPPALEDVLDRFDRVQGSLSTLSADFTETTETPLLKEPLVARGRVFLTKPDSVLWEYTAPEPMRFVIAKDEYIGLFPERKRAEKRDMKRWSERIFRYFGLGQSSKELEKIYDIELRKGAAENGGDYLLALTPRKHRMKKAVEEVLLSVDGKTMLPSKIAYEAKDGSRRTIVFRNTQLNPQLAANLYEVEIPSGFEVTKGFSALGANASSR